MDNHSLMSVVARSPMPEAWQEGDNIPWHDSEFSRRMLQEHLSQSHDAASRRSPLIDRHVRWIHSEVLQGEVSNILDLACGPGLYTERLARLGHQCFGIDYSPASVDYARRSVQRHNPGCRYLLEDIRMAEFGNGRSFAMLIYGEFNVFRPADGAALLDKIYDALNPEGLLLLEPHTFVGVQRIGEQPSLWYSASHGLFSDSPHIVLEESFWLPDCRAAAVRYIVVDAAGGEVDRFAQTLQAYTVEEYQAVLADHGFAVVAMYAGLASNDEPDLDADLMAIVARKMA